MSVAEAEVGGAPGARPTLPPWITLVVALALATVGLVGAALAFAGPATYADLMGIPSDSSLAPDDRATLTFPLEGGGSWTVGRSVLGDLHERTLAYVLGRADGLPAAPDGRPLFDARERAHLSDVRDVFRGAQIAALLALGLLLATGIVGARRGGGTLHRLVRDASLGAGAAVLVLAVAAAVAFEPAFLLFHRIFFPQGNFLFDPATSNLLRLYPEPYWYGVTLRVGLSFLVTSALVAGIAHAGLRRKEDERGSGSAGPSES